MKSVTKYQGKFLRVSLDYGRDPEGHAIERLVVHHGGSAVVLPVDRNGSVLLVRQYRMPAGKYLWELPAGRIDSGEKPLTAAKRELAEETGYRARDWKRLASFYASPGFLSEKMHVYVARDLVAGEAEPEEDERVSSKWFPLALLSRWVDQGKIEDAKTLIGILAWRQSVSAQWSRKAV
jgi:ADP-ribose pyrophosphatase